MLRLVLSFCLALAAAPAFAQAITQAITPGEAESYVGKHVTVEGIVSEVHHAASGRATFIDMGGRYPNNVFSAVVFSDDAPKFPGIDSLEGKMIDVTGTVVLYKRRPEIILNDAAQIKVK